MKNKFQEYFNYSEKTISKLWEDSVFIFDTNVLLDLYRYSKKTRDEFLELIDKFKDRIWIPHQIAKEFLEDRTTVIITQESYFDKCNSIINEIKNFTEERMKGLDFKYHPSINKDELLNKIYDGLEKIKEDIKGKKESHSDLLSDDFILNKIIKLYDGKVGDEYQEEKLIKIFDEGKNRYQKKIPPGYSDSEGKNKKDGDRIYGDLIIWKQIIDYASNKKINVIFVSNDGKEDWWQIVKGKTIGCRPELKKEIRLKANIKFHMYNSDRFLYYAKSILSSKITDESIKEVKEVRINQRLLENNAFESLRSMFEKDSELFKNLEALSAQQSLLSAMRFDKNLLPPDKSIAKFVSEQLSSLKIDTSLLNHINFYDSMKGTRDLLELAVNKERFDKELQAYKELSLNFSKIDEKRNVEKLIDGNKIE